MIKYSESAPTLTFSLLQESTMRFQQGKGTNSDMSALGDPRVRGLGRHPGHRLLPDRAGRRVCADGGNRSVLHP